MQMVEQMLLIIHVMILMAPVFEETEHIFLNWLAYISVSFELIY